MCVLLICGLDAFSPPDVTSHPRILPPIFATMSIFRPQMLVKKTWATNEKTSHSKVLVLSWGHQFLGCCPHNFWGTTSEEFCTQTRTNDNFLLVKISCSRFKRKLLQSKIVSLCIKKVLVRTSTCQQTPNYFSQKKWNEKLFLSVLLPNREENRCRVFTIGNFTASI